MPIYEVVLRQNYANQECVNRWNYVLTGTPAAVQGSFALIAAFGAISLAAETIIGKVRSLQNQGVNFVDIEARDIYSDLDFYTRPFASSTNGQGLGEGMSPVMAYGFRTSRTRRDIRRATKRFVGAEEGNVAQAGVLTSGVLTVMEELADLMEEPLTYDDEGNTLTFVPAVCSKEEYTTPSGKKAYRYRANEALQLDFTATGFLWEVYDTIRTQNSRQYGRGR